MCWRAHWHFWTTQDCIPTYIQSTYVQLSIITIGRQGLQINSLIWTKYINNQKYIQKDLNSSYHKVNLFFPWCNPHRQPNDTKQNQHNLILVNSWTPISSLTLHGMTGKVKFINVECRIWVELYRLTKEVKKAKKQLSSFKLLKLKDCHCNQSSSKGRASLLHACFRPNWEV